MSQHLPLVAAQPGIWMAEKLSDLPSAWSVAHYVELTGDVDAPLLARAVLARMAILPRGTLSPMKSVIMCRNC